MTPSNRTPKWLLLVLLVTMLFPSLVLADPGYTNGHYKIPMLHKRGISGQLFLNQGRSTHRRLDGLVFLIRPQIVRDDDSRKAPAGPLFASKDDSPVDTLEAWAKSSATSAAGGQTAGLAMRGPSLWGMFYGGSSKYQNLSDRDGFRACTYGFLFGLSYPMGDDFLVGFMMAYEHSAFDIRHRGGNGDTESFRFGPYASKRFGAWYVNASLTAGLHWVDYRRYEFGFENKGDYGACDLTLASTIGRDFQLSPAAVISPYVTMVYSYLNQKSFRETGFMPLARRYDSTQETGLTTYFGTRFRYDTTLCGMAMTLGLDAAWAHQCFYGDEDQVPGYAISPGSIAGPKEQFGTGSRNFFVYGANVEIPLTDSRMWHG